MTPLNIALIALIVLITVMYSIVIHNHEKTIYDLETRLMRIEILGRDNDEETMV